MSKNWQRVCLRDVVRPVVRPEAPVPGTQYRQLGVRLWGVGAYEREPVDGGSTKYRTLSRVEADDLVVNKIWARNGSVAVVASGLGGCFVSGEFPCFVPDTEQLAPRWMHWLTKTPGFWAQCDAKSQGTSGKNRIKPQEFLGVEIPLPPLPEQRRIVARIEELAAKVEEAKAFRVHATDEAKSLFEQTRAATFRELLEGDVCTLSDLATLERGKFSHRPRNDPRFFGGNHPWIQIAQIEASDRHITEWTETLNDDGLAISKKFPKGTVLVSIAATIGAVGVLGFDCCVPDSIVGLTPRHGIDSGFLYHYLGFVRSHLEGIAPQSAQKNINLKILSPLPAPRLPQEEQRVVADYLDALWVKIRGLNCAQQYVAAELDALLPAILDRAFKGEL